MYKATKWANTHEFISARQCQEHRVEAHPHIWASARMLSSRPDIMGCTLPLQIHTLSMITKKVPVATVEHGVPLVRPKWVHRLWALQEGGQGNESRPAGGPPHLPHGYLTSSTSTTTAKGLGDLPGSPPTRQTTRRTREPERPTGGQARSWVSPSAR